MNQDLANATSEGDINKLDLILLAVERLQQDLQLAKGEIKTAIREISLHQNSMYDLFLKFHADFRDIDTRLHGMELSQQRQNSST